MIISDNAHNSKNKMLKISVLNLIYNDEQIILMAMLLLAKYLLKSNDLKFMCQVYNKS